MAPLHDHLRNHVLAALPGAELKRWLPGLEPVAMPLGMVLRTRSTSSCAAGSF